MEWISNSRVVKELLNVHLGLCASEEVHSVSNRDPPRTLSPSGNP